MTRALFLTVRSTAVSLSCPRTRVFPRPAGWAWRVVLLAGLCLSGRTGALPAQDAPRFAPDAVEFFQQKVKPLLEARCYECHAANAKRLEGGLRLDSRPLTLKGGDTGPAAVAGKPDDSLIIKAVRYEDFEMPPRGRLPDGEIAILVKWVELGLPWSEDGLKAEAATAAFPLDARRQSHWAWQPVREVAPPVVKQAGWPRGEIDRFLLAGLESQGLSPAPDADRRTLIRRANFVLTGLPPEPAEVEAFLSDPAETPQAFATVVDRLLASPHYGERWARHWLDLVRYGETLGHEFDYPLHHASRYRDYVVRAFNADVPYDRFVREHIAGDLLTDPRRHPADGTNESILGTGFWFLGELKHAPVDVKGEEAGIIDNQLDVFSKTFLALTVSCARCHDHKFDAITAQDYYALAGYLQSSRRQQAYLDPHGRVEEGFQKLRAVHAQAEKLLRTETPAAGAGKAVAEGRRDPMESLLRATRAVLLNLSETGMSEESLKAVAAREAAVRSLETELLTAWIRALSASEVDQPAHPLFLWKKLALTKDVKSFVPVFEQVRKQLEDMDGKRAAFHAKTELVDDFEDGRSSGWFATGWAFGDESTTGLRWQTALPDAEGSVSSGRFGKKARGVLRSSDFTLTKPTLFYRLAGENVRVRLIIDGYVMDEFSGLLFGGCRFDVNNPQLHWHRQGGDVKNYVGHRAHIELIDEGDGWIVVDEIRLADEDARPVDPVSALTRKILQADRPLHDEDSLHVVFADWLARSLQVRDAPAGDGLPVAEAALRNWMTQHGLTAQHAQLAGLRKQADELDAALPAPEYALAIMDGSSENEHLFIRGSHKNLGPVVERRMLEAISGRNQSRITAGSGRLELAERLLDPANPFPARVMVNRIWHQVFGRGLVESVDNFGVLGKPPTHPELLDWLATQFVKDGWSIRSTIRRMLLSRAWQMASDPLPETEDRDPENLLWHRMAVHRLEGEAIRDAMLVVSGRLDRTPAGGSVPVHLTPFMQGRGRPGSGPLDGNGRRSLYVSVNRNFLSPMMLAFDTPIPFTTIGRRNVSNVPAQALILMNDPFVLQQAGVWADRELKDSGLSPEMRIARLYDRAFTRPATVEEIAEGVAFLQSQAAGYDSGIDWKSDRRVWADLCHVLFNVKEFIFVR